MVWLFLRGTSLKTHELLFLAALGLHCCSRAFLSLRPRGAALSLRPRGLLSRCGHGGLLSRCGPWASCCRGSMCLGPQTLGAWTSVVHGPSCFLAWGSPQVPGMELASPALRGRFETPGPPGKPSFFLFNRLENLLYDIN